MPTYNEQMQQLWKQYESAGMPMPANLRDVAGWAIDNKLWAPRRADIIAQCAEELAKAL